MRKTNPPSRKTYSPDCIQTDQLPALVEGWLLTCDINRCSQRTIGNRRDLLSRLQWFLENRKVLACDSLALKQFFHYLKNGHLEPGGRWGNPKATRPTTPGTAQTYHRNFRAFFNYLITEDRLEASPMEKIPTPINRPDQIEPLDEDQARRFLEASARTSNPKRDKAVAYVLLDTGVRASELLGLRIADADLSACQLSVREGKGGKSRIVPFSPDTRKVVYDYLRERGEVATTDFLLLSDRGTTAGATLSRIGLLKLVNRIGEAAGMPGVHPHRLRHTFAISFLRNGGNQFTLMNMLGHTSLAMTNNYVKIAQSDTDRQHRQFSPVTNLKKRKR